ncbi:MAG: biopolymer transporter ExbD [Planctomycetota bacterium]|nr:biopolymer transporter ExbD [Planctomycetota bacterium]
MAMVNTKALAAEEPEAFFTSMIDIVFLLLIFFMCATKFRTLESQLAFSPPREEGVTSEAPPPVPPPDAIRILVADNVAARESESFNARILRTATYYLGSRYSRPFSDVNMLEPPLRAAAAANPRQAVIIAPADEARNRDQLVPFFNVVAAMDVARRAGIKEVRFQAPRCEAVPITRGG